MLLLFCAPRRRRDGVLRVQVLSRDVSRNRGEGIYSAKAMTPMTVAMMMFTALSLIESASIPASLSLRTADAIQRAAAVSVAPKASPETMDVA